MRVRLLPCDLTFQLDFGMRAFEMGGESRRMWLKRLEKIYFENRSPVARTATSACQVGPASAGAVKRGARSFLETMLPDPVMRRLRLVFPTRPKLVAPAPNTSP